MTGQRLDSWPPGHAFVGLSPDTHGIEFDATHGQLNLWSTNHNRPVSSVRLNAFVPDSASVPSGVGLTLDARYFFRLRTNGLVHVWDTTAGQLIRELKVRVVPLVCARLSSDTRWLAISPEAPYEAYLYDTRDGTERVLRGHTEYVKSMAFSPDSSQLATAGIDGRIRIWDASSGKELRTLAAHWQGVDDVAYAPDGRTLASIESRTCVKLWRLDTMLEVVSVPMADAAEYLAFAPTNDRLAVVHTDGRVTFLEAPLP
jgi:WD40 repeat protein